ncbi:PAN-1 domain protein [Niveomyces insectorum RCEF 264]|uniref:PAN-1 domain protein n=1 Tax=Niveomyces insectorum RCEF 264 TaxID=1081102 RepID=A0A167PWC0_9HYPO|nr:PAN-1 domain protein [Niveomyces insectorum RCEF 264]
MRLPSLSSGMGNLFFPRQLATSIDAGGGNGGPPGGPPRGPPGRGFRGHKFGNRPPFGGGGGRDGGGGGGGGTGGGGDGNGGDGGGDGGDGGGDGGDGGNGSTTNPTNNACPQANGTAIGSVQEFTLFCGSSAAGDIINSTTTDSFADCTVACASFHPKCEAVSFDGSNCQLKANLPADDATAASTTLNAGVALFPPASSNCGTLGASVTQGSMNFNIFCGNIINGGDLVQMQTATMQDCMTQCVNTSGCGGISYDATYSLGFKNCYLKTTGPPAPIVDAGVDSAVVGNAAAADSSSSSAAAAPSTTAAAPPPPPPPTSTAAPATTLSPASTTTGVGIGGFTTLPASLTQPAPSVVTQTVVSTLTSVSNSVSRTIATTEVITVSMLGTSVITGPIAVSTGTSSASLTNAYDGSSNSRAWIAAPVVGSVAAVMVVAVMFVMWGRRRRGNGFSSPISPSFFSRFRGGSSGGTGGGMFGSGFRNLSSSASNRGGMRSPFGRPQLPFGNYWRAGSSKANSTAATKSGNSTSAGTSSRKVVDEEAGGASRSGTGYGKSVPLIIDTGLNRSASSGNSKSKEKARSGSSGRDANGNDSSRPSTSRGGTGSRGNDAPPAAMSEKPVPSRDLTMPQYELKEGKVALRDSMNGLAQNRATLDGIPIFLRE